MKHPAQHKSEEGLVLVLFAMIIIVAMTILAMVVDHSKQSLALSTLQRAADAAALSGAKRFNGKISGWRDAKKASIVAIKGNGILGVDQQKLQNLILEDGPSRDDDSRAKHSGSIGSAAGLDVSVERGVIWFDPDLTGPSTAEHPKGKPGGYRFVSLEVNASELSHLPIPVGIDGFLYSNAVRVKLRIRSLATSFGQIIGIDSFDNLTRTAIAVTHEELELPAAPFAIPLCALRLNNNPTAKPDEQALKEIDFSKQCTRQGIATEADPKRELPGLRNRSIAKSVDQEILKRREGLTRFEANIRPTYFNYLGGGQENSCYDNGYSGPAHNCKDIPLYGVLGVPSMQPGQQATARQVAEGFQQGVLARPGMYFAPLPDLKGFTSNPMLSDVIAGAIMDPSSYGPHVSSLSFADAFTDPVPEDNPAYAYFKRSAKRNFPHIRTYRPPCGQDPERRPCFQDDPLTPENESDPHYDLRITWPTPYMTINPQTNEEEPVLGKMLVDRQEKGKNGVYSRQPLDYTHTSCHHPSIPIDSVNRGDPERHRVRRMLAPVIVPGTDTRPDGNPVMYCNYGDVFTGYENESEASAVAPIPETLPVIVGFMPIYAYDVGLRDLDRVKAFQPPASANVLDPGSIMDLSPRIARSFIWPPFLVVPPNGWAPVSVPFFRDPSTGETIVDRVPGELDFENQFMEEARNNLAKYEEDQDEWFECADATSSDCDEKRPQPQGGSFFNIPEEFIRCFEFKIARDQMGDISGGIEREGGATLGDVVELVQEIPPDTCVEESVLGTTTSRKCIKEKGPAKSKSAAAFKVMDEVLNHNIPSRDWSRCLAMANLQDPNHTKNKNDPDHYVKPIDNPRLFVGCGGVAFKPACGTEDDIDSNTLFLPGGRAWDQTTPALVAEDVEQ